ncbi:MAG TPA: 23S rRNA (uracil(1939)-C(5))-methyltransferase RlmD, partial [Crinalium sp.]
RYPKLAGVSLNVNPDRTNAIFGRETICVAGQPYLHETFAGLTFQLRPDTFFQIHTEQAEALLQTIIDELQLQGHELLLDAYCGIGTFTLPLAARVRQAIGLEVQPEAVEQARLSASLNQLENVTFTEGAVETLLPQLGAKPDIVLLDPPRRGCDAAVIEALTQLAPDRIVYISCNPATLARDLKLLCQDNQYRLARVQPVDFFPQTPHVECVAFLVR